MKDMFEEVDEVQDMRKLALDTYAKNPFALLQTEMDINTFLEAHGYSLDSLGFKNVSEEDLRQEMSITLNLFEIMTLRSILGFTITEIEDHMQQELDIKDFL